MIVFYDPADGAVTWTMMGDRVPATDEPHVIVPDERWVTLTGLRVVDGLVVRDLVDPVYQDSLRRLIDIERDRRMKAGFVFQGVAYDFDDASKARITGMATLAGFALGQGAQAGDYLWAGEAPFVWIASDNSFVPMDAPTCFAFGQAAAGHEIAFIFAARMLKDQNPIPEDFSNAAYWPEGVS